MIILKSKTTIKILSLLLSIGMTNAVAAPWGDTPANYPEESKLDQSPDDFPDSIINAQMDSSTETIDVMSEGINKKQYARFFAPYSKSGVDGVVSSEVKAIDYTRKTIEGVMESDYDVDVIPIRIPDGHYFSVGVKKESYDRGEIPINVELIPKEPDHTYNSLLNGNIFARGDVKNENGSDMIANAYFGEYYRGVDHNGASYEGSYYTRAIRNFLVSRYEGEEYYAIVYTANGRGEELSEGYKEAINFSFPGEYSITVDVSESFFPIPPSAPERFIRTTYEGKQRLSIREDKNNLPDREFIPLSESNNECKIPDNRKGKVNDGCWVMNCVAEPGMLTLSEKEYAEDEVAKCVNYFENSINNFEQIRDNAYEEYEEQGWEHYSEQFNSHMDRIVQLSPFYNSIRANRRKPITIVGYNDEEEGVKKETYNKLRLTLASKVTDTNPFKVQKQPIELENKRTGEVEKLDATESSCVGGAYYNNGETVQPLETSKCFVTDLIEQKLTPEIVPEKGVMGMQDGDTLIFRASYDYENPYFSELDQTYESEETIKVKEWNQNANFTVKPSTKITPGETVNLTVEDFDKNENRNEIDTMIVYLNTLRGGLHKGFKEITLKETSENSGVFKTKLETGKLSKVKEGDGLYGVKDNDIMKFNFTDNQVVQGDDEDLLNSEKDEPIDYEARVNVVEGFAGKINVTSPNKVGSKMTVTVEDKNLGTNSYRRERVPVTIKNERTGETKEIELKENGTDSSKFDGDIIGVADKEPNREESTIKVLDGDSLKAIYIDERNANLEEETISDTGYFQDNSDTIKKEMDVDKNLNVYDDVIFSVDDEQLNNDPESIEEGVVIITNERTGEQTERVVVENNKDSSTFKGTVTTTKSDAPTDDENTIGVLKDDVLDFTYRDDFVEENTLNKQRIVSEAIDAQIEVGKNLIVSKMIGVSVVDEVANTQSTSKDEVNVEIKNTNNEQVINQTLKETDVNTGKFKAKLETEFSQNSLNSDNIMGVQKNDVVDFRYFYGDEQTLSTQRKAKAGIDGEIIINPNLPENKGLRVGKTIDIRLDDADVNENSDQKEKVIIDVENKTTGQIIEEFELVETDVDTGVFKAQLPTAFNKEVLDSSSLLGIKNKDKIEFHYIDAFTAIGKKDVAINKVKEAFGGTTGELKVTDEAYVNDSIDIEVDDSDENEQSNAIDYLEVTLENQNTNEKETIELTETNVNSGVFRGSIDTQQSQNKVPESDLMGVDNEHVINVVYNDQFTKMGGVANIKDSVNFIKGYDGEIDVSSPNKIGEAMTVTVKDKDLNVSNDVDSVLVNVKNKRTDEREELHLMETGSETGVFEGKTFGVNDMVDYDEDSVRGASHQVASLTTLSGDYIEASYMDKMNANGNEETLKDEGVFLGEDAIVMDKVAQKDSVKIGDFVPYQISIENRSPNDLADVRIVDELPSGFRMAKETISLDNETRDANIAGRILTVHLNEIDAGETKNLSYVLKPSSGVVEGVYENKVSPYLNNFSIGNEAQANVRINKDSLFTDALVFGKVFHDKNENGYQDKGEEGIAGVTIAGVEGMNVVTDGKGRFHIEAVDGGRMERGRNHILKVMPKSLPDGATLTTENPRVQRITQGMPSKFNFGVKLPERGAYKSKVEVKLAEVFFDWDKAKVKDKYKEELKEVVSIIEEKGGGIITIEGNTDSLGTDKYNEELGLHRASAVYKVLKRHLSDDTYQRIEVKPEF